MRLTHYDEHKKRWQINDDYGAVMIDELNYAVGEAIDKLAAYEDAEEQGRMVILPKTLYEAGTTPPIKGVTEWKVTGVRYYDGTVQAYTTQTKNVQAIIYGREIGETVFLTREEAEAALKGED